MKDLKIQYLDQMDILFSLFLHLECFMRRFLQPFNQFNVFVDNVFYQLVNRKYQIQPFDERSKTKKFQHPSLADQQFNNSSFLSDLLF